MDEQNRPTKTATLYFDLTETNYDFIAAIHGMKYWNALWNIKEEIHRKAKYQDDETIYWSNVKELITDILDANEVNLEEIK